MTDQETVVSLGLIAHERKKFLRSLKTVECKFQRRLKEVKMLAKQKAKHGMDLITKQVGMLFKEEWAGIVDQFNEMRSALYTSEQQLFLAEAQKFYLEEENLEIKAYIAENRPRYLPEYMEDFALDPDNPELDELAI